MKRRISRRTMRRRKIMSFLRKVQCGRGRFENFDQKIRDLEKFKHAKPQTGRGINIRGTFVHALGGEKNMRLLSEARRAKQTGRGIFNNMVGDYAWGQRMKYRI